jgi:hypothetical protein
MSYKVFLKFPIQPIPNLLQFEEINAGVRESQSKVLGDVLSDLSCEIIEQVFLYC